MATRYEHTGNAVPTTLTSSITNVSTAINIASSAGWPSGSVGAFWVTLDVGTASEEKVLCVSRSGTVLTVLTRGADGTTATAHASGASVLHTFSATEAEDANILAAAVTTLGGTVVTTTAAQTLTNKTLTSPTLTNPTLTSPFVPTGGLTLQAVGAPIEIGAVGTANSPLIDFHSGATGTDYDSRLIASGGTGSSGGGTLDVKAAAFTLNTVPVATTTDVQTLTNKTLTAPQGDVARGYLAGATKTTDGSGITSGAGVTDLTGLSATATVGASRRVRVTAQIVYALSTTTATCNFYIREGSTTLARVTVNVTAETGGVATFSWVGLPTAAAHTYKLSAATTAGSLRQSGDGTGEMLSSITVEDIGV